MNVIVTGASGFIGKNIVLKSPKTWDVVALYNQSLDFPQFIQRQKLKHVTAQPCDLTREKDIERLAKKNSAYFDLCIYLSANGNPAFSALDPLIDLKKNTLALVNFLNQIRIERFVFFSSGAVYDGLKGKVSPEMKINPKLPYAISKCASEQYVQFFTQKGRVEEYVILRFFGAFGQYEPERKIYTKLIKTFFLEKKNKFTVRGDGRNLIDAMYIDDTIEGIFKVVASKNKNLTVDFCSGQPITIDELVKKAALVFKRNKINIVHEGEVAEYIAFRASSLAMNRLFGFKPRISLEEGLTRFAEFLKDSKVKHNA